MTLVDWADSVVAYDISLNSTTTVKERLLLNPGNIIWPSN